MKVYETKLPGVLLIMPSVHFDHRGSFVETWNAREYQALCGPFLQDDLSRSKHNVLRGIHGDQVTTKLLSCAYGRINLVVVAPDKKKWEVFKLDDAECAQVLVPPGHGNAYLVCSEEAVFSYKQTTYYNRASQFTWKWNDPEIGIAWPITNPILSERDA